MVHSSTSIQHPTGRAARAALLRFSRGAPSRQVALNNSDSRRGAILGPGGRQPAAVFPPGGGSGRPTFF